jgi:hypothetical protein
MRPSVPRVNSRLLQYARQAHSSSSNAIVGNRKRQNCPVVAQVEDCHCLIFAFPVFLVVSTRNIHPPFYRL